MCVCVRERERGGGGCFFFNLLNLFGVLFCFVFLCLFEDDGFRPWPNLPRERERERESLALGLYNCTVEC